MNTATQNPHLDTAHKMLKEGKTFDQIQHHLLSTGEDSEVVNELMKHVKDERYEAQRKKRNSFNRFRRCHLSNWICSYHIYD